MQTSNVTFDCKYHVVWCSKYKMPVLKDEVEEMLKETLIRESKNFGTEILKLEIDLNHVHLLISCDPQFGVHKAIRGLKSLSARELRDSFAHLKSTMPSMWTNNYYIGTVGTVNSDTIRNYIDNQQIRTKKKSS